MKMWKKGLVAIFAIALMGGSAFATDVGDVLADPEYAATEEATEIAAQEFADKLNGDVSTFAIAIGQATGNTLLSAVATVASSTDAEAVAYANSDSGQNLDNLFDTDALAASGVTAQAVVNDINMISGSGATVAANNAASTVTRAIGGQNGVIGNRQLALRNERRGVNDKVGNDSALASVAMNQDFARRIWASPFYTKQKGDQNKVNEAYDFKAWGVSVGYDHVFGAFAVGGAFTYSDGDYDVEKVNDDNKIKSYGFSLYGQYYDCNTGIFGTLAGGYTYGDNEWNRYSEVNNVWQRGDNHTNSYWVGGNIGKDFVFGDGYANKFVITPTIGLYWSESKGSEYRSSGVYNQIIGKSKVKSFEMPIDIEARYTRELTPDSSITFKAAGGYAYDFKNDGGDGSARFDYAGANTIKVFGTEPGRHSWNVGGGVQYRYKQVDFGVDYRYDGRKKFDGHRVSGTVGISF